MSFGLPDVRTARGLAKCVPASFDPSHLRVEYNRPPTIKQVFVSIFLPDGYPSSVTPDYLRYVVWQFVQGLCSTITGMLSSKATLEGLGVGEASAGAATATLFLALKDAVGRIASIGFAWWRGSQLDCNAKRWRLTADVANDIGILLELVAPLAAMFTAWWVFVVLLSIANLARAIAGVAGGATRVSVVQHFALKDNIADLSAKAGSQEIAGGLIGMLLGMFITTVVDRRPLLTWIIVLLFTGLHIFANWLSLKMVYLKTVNRQRGHLLFQHYFARNEILSPKRVSVHEGIWARVWSDRSLRIGVTPDVATTSTSHLVNLLGQFVLEKYVLTMKSDGTIVVLLKESATAQDQIQSLFQAEYIYFRRQHNPTLSPEELVSESLAHTIKTFAGVAQLLAAEGWNLTTPHLAAGDARLVDKSK